MPSVLGSTCPSRIDKLQCEKAEPDPLLDSQETQEEQNGASTVTIPPEGGKKNKTCLTALQSWLEAWDHHWAVHSLVLNFILISIIVCLIGTFIIIFTQPAKTHEPCQAAPPSAAAPCPNSWVRHLGKCYYFSKDEENWNSSQSNCSALHASLAVIDTQEELDFIRNYEELSDSWIGLWKDVDQTWKWTNGTEFNHRFAIKGNERCAFINRSSASSAGCSGKRRWVCNKLEKTTDKVQ